MKTENNPENKIINNVLKEIENKKICPTPKWCFVCKNFSFWLIVVFSAIIVSLSLSLMIFLFVSHDWDVYELESGNLVKHIIVYTPYLWIIIFLLFVFLTIKIFSKTKEGYKFGFFKSFIAGFLLIIILSSFATIFGLSSKINDEFRQKIPAYKSFVKDRCDIWDNPEKGLLSGEIIKIINNEEFVLKCSSGVVWIVKKENTKLIPETLEILEGKKIKMIGKKEAENFFIVNTIKPW